MKYSFENDENNINYQFNPINNPPITSFPESFSENIFKNINQKEINNYRCNYCDNIPFPKVFKFKNILNKENNKIICNNCYSRLKEEDNFLKDYYLDEQNSNIIKQIIGNYKVSCINIGCTWEGKLLQLKPHIEKECEYQLINCPNSECKSILLRKYLKSHLINCKYDKIIKKICNYCHEEIKNQKIEEHIEECPEIYEECDKNCGKKLKRKELINHKKICPENLMKCKYWKYGCKKVIKRKYLEDHEKLEMRNHYNLINNYRLTNEIENNNENIAISNIINELEKKIREKDKFFVKNKNNENKEKDYSDFNWDIKFQQQRQTIKNKHKYNDYIPFTGEPIQFFTERENIYSKIIELKDECIYYHGNYNNNYQNEKYYFVIAKDNLNLNNATHFKFKIYALTNELPWISFGIYSINNENEYIFNEINDYPSYGLYCIDLNSNTCNNGVYSESESDDITDILDTNTIITMSYLPFDVRRLIIKDNSDFEIEFHQVPNKNCALRFCFIFKGKDGAKIDYNYS